MELGKFSTKLDMFLPKYIAKKKPFKNLVGVISDYVAYVKFPVSLV